MTICIIFTRSSPV